MSASVQSASPAGLMPPDDSRWGGPMVLALVAHALLAAALTWGIGWNRTQTPVVAEAELWSRMPQSAAPKLVEEAPPPPPAPEPEPEPVVAKPVPPRLDPVAAQQALDAQRDAQIALQQQKKREEARRDEAKRLQQDALKKKQALEREAQEKAQAKEREKRAAEKKAAEEAKRQALKDQQAKAAKDKTAKDKAVQAAAEKADKANAERLAKERAENLKHIAGMAGATGAPGSSGTALKSSGPSATYAGRIVGAVRPNIVFTDIPVGNSTADVEVRTLPDGTIASRRLVKSSGNPAWDDAVLKALDRTARLPRDEDGRVPATLVIGFRPRD